MPLFDDCNRTDSSPARNAEDAYSFLNRAAGAIWGNVRDELERWYAEYPDEERNWQLARNFQQPHPAQHFGAWWELYLHHLFRHLGFAVDVEPDDVPGGKPDFRITSDAGSFLLEATTSFSGIADDSRQSSKEAAVLDAINQAQSSNFFVGVEFENVGEQQPGVGDIVEPLERWLETLDPDEAGQSYFDAPERTFDVRGWRIKYTALAVKPEARGRPHRMLGVGPITVGWVNDRVKLSAALAGKGRKYKPREPYVVAVLMMSSGTMDAEDIAAALLGPVRYPVLEDGFGEPFREPNGFWLRGNEKRGTRVSAVLLGNNITPESAARTWPRLWPNPWAARPLREALPFPRGVIDTDGRVEFEEVAGLPSDVLGVPEEWPNTGTGS